MTRSLLLSLLLPLCASAQGPLNPPAGPPSPTMKTLDQVEPRIPVNSTTAAADASSTFVIRQPGSYYLQGNASGAGKSYGVIIQATGVTLDLSGYTISGGSTACVSVAQNSRATIRGGTLDAASGLSCLRAQGSLIAEELLLRGASEFAIHTDSPATLRRCEISNSGLGAFLGGGASLVAECMIRDITGGPAVVLRGDGSDLRDSVLARIDLDPPYSHAVDLGGTAHRVLGNRIGPVGGCGILAAGMSHEVRANHIVVVPSGPALEASSQRVVFRDNTFESPGHPSGMIRGSNGGGNTALLSTNTAPTAVIFISNPSIPYGQPINLSGDRSFESDGDALSYAWTILSRPGPGAGISGSGVNVSIPASAAAPLVPGRYRIRLVVTDSTGLNSVPAEIEVIVQANGPPTAVLDQTTTSPRAGQLCVLSGSRSFDEAPGSVVRYTFTLTSRPTGSTRPLNTPVQQTTPTFNGFTPDVAGRYQWRLIVTDDSGSDSLPYVLEIVVTN